MQPGYKKRSKTQWQLIHRNEFQQWVANSFGKGSSSLEANDPENVCPLAPHQHIVKDFLTDSPYRGLVLYHGLGVGKCHAKDTCVVMYDGTVKLVQDVVERDVLLGDDGGPRTVLSLARGRDRMYRVDQHNAESYTCNQAHILCLKRQGDKEERIVEIPIKDFVSLSLDDQVALKGYATDVVTFSVAVTFPYPFLHPYIVGYWLADNMSASMENSVAHISCRTSRVRKYINQLCASSSLELIHRGMDCHVIVDQRGNNAFEGLRKQYIAACGIPNVYKVASPESRQHFLAGIVDRFGRIQDGCVVLEDTSSQYLSDIQFIARSLGIRCAAKADQKFKTCVVKLFGPRVRELPLCAPYINNQMHLVDRDDVLSNITLCELGEDEYYGFVLDGNSRYVLHDFTITHNTRAAIAIAETLSASHKINVLVPASLESNFVSEILLCGNREYQYTGVWSYHSKDAADYADIKAAGLAAGVKESTLRKNRGIWVRAASSDTGTHNFEQLTDAQRQQIGAQIKDMVQFRYSFMHYNGLNASQLSALTRDDTFNPFDDSIVIIDEVHNLISRIVNNSSIAGKLVQLLMSARGAKILMLSGTPIINRPVELAHICNLARGPLSYVVASVTGAMLPRLEEVLSSSPLVDYYEVDPTTASVMIVPLPFGFQWDIITKSQRQNVVKSTGQTKVYDIKSFKAYLESTLKLDDGALSIRSSTLLPIDEETFDDLFIDYAQDAVIKNSMLLARRLQGIVSHYARYDAALFPTVSDINYVHVDMSAGMLKKYMEVREDEIKKESSSSTTSRAGKSKSELTSGSVYRSYSRAVCNFTFPPAIKRPYPSTMRHWKFETVSIDDDAAPGEQTTTEGDELATNTQIATKTQHKDEYAAAVEKAMQKLAADKEKFLMGKNLVAYGPKFAACIERIGSSPGSSVVYSQFRSVEGLGVMELVLQAHRYKKLAVARDKTTNDWRFTETLQFDRPHYCVFTSDDREQNEIVLSIMNNNLAALPRSIRDQLSVAWKKQHKTNDITNLHGELVKVLMITQSGAEGISLKNVRQVHVIEPYWNAIRIEQVIGRAVRAGSHLELPESERHVDVYMYITKFTQDQMKEQVVLERERGVTSDEYILGIAQRKTRLTNAFLKLMKQSAIDCLVHSADRKECTTFPANFGSPPGVMYSYKGIGDDTKDAVLKQQVKVVKVSRTIGFVRCGRNKYPFRRDTMELLDPTAFDADAKTQIVIGRVMVDASTRKPNLVLYDAGPIQQDVATLNSNPASSYTVSNTNTRNANSNSNTSNAAPGQVANSNSLKFDTNSNSSVPNSNARLNSNSNSNTNTKYSSDSANAN